MQHGTEQWQGRLITLHESEAARRDAAARARDAGEKSEVRYTYLGMWTILALYSTEVSYV